MHWRYRPISLLVTGRTISIQSCHQVLLAVLAMLSAFRWTVVYSY